jgi:hypothetical protein
MQPKLNWKIIFDHKIAMRIGVFILLNLVFATFMLRADEVLPVLRVGADVYSNVTVTAVTPTDIYFTSEKGMGNAKLKNLDPTLQKHFKFDPAKVAAADAAEKKQMVVQSQAAIAAANQPIDPAKAQAMMDDAIAHVKAIVNQPVRALPRAANMDVTVYSPGWFHPGAQEPEYVDIDIRATQDLQYGQHAYVTSDLNPGVAFVGSQVEFNANTKYFYEDRSLPKARLTEDEMLEINRLYRVIAKCRAALDPANKPEAPPEMLSMSFLSLHKRELMIGGAVLLVLLVGIRFLTRGRP